MRIFPLTPLLILLFSACASVPNTAEDIRAIRLPEKWQQTEPVSPSPNTLVWWQAIDDDLLKQYLHTAQTHNLDIEAAAYRLRQYAVQNQLAIADRLPRLSASASASSSKPLDEGTSSRRFSSSAGLSWSADIFGTLAKTQDVKQWLAEASAADVQQLKNRTISETAEQYWQLAAINAQLALADDDIQTAQQQLKIMHTRYRVGDVAKMDVLESEQHLRTQERNRDDLQHRRNQTRHALTLLLGKVVDDQTLAEPTRLPEITLPPLPDSLPAQLLDRRADIRAARWRLMADMGNVDVAVRQFFPQINLNISASASGSQLSQIVQNPLGVLSLDALLPFLNWPQNQLNLQVAQWQYQENRTNFKKTLYSALVEVENAFSQQNQLNREAKRSQADLQAAKTLAEIAHVRHQHGDASWQDVLQAQTQYNNAQQAKINNHLARYQNFLTLQLALGEPMSNTSPDGDKVDQ